MSITMIVFSLAVIMVLAVFWDVLNESNRRR